MLRRRAAEDGDGDRGLPSTLAARGAWRSWKRIAAGPLGPVTGAGASPITAAALYTRWAEFLRPGD